MVQFSSFLVNQITHRSLVHPRPRRVRPFVESCLVPDSPDFYPLFLFLHLLSASLPPPRAHLAFLHSCPVQSDLECCLCRCLAWSGQIQPVLVLVLARPG